MKGLDKKVALVTGASGIQVQPRTPLHNSNIYATTNPLNIGSANFDCNLYQWLTFIIEHGGLGVGYMMQSDGTIECHFCVRLQGVSLLKALGELDDWSAIYAVARSEIPLSSKTHRLALDLDDKEVMTHFPSHCFPV